MRKPLHFSQQRDPYQSSMSSTIPAIPTVLGIRHTNNFKKSQFGDVVDAQHALQLLRNTQQKPGETIQVFAKCLICYAEQAWPGQNLTSPLIEAQLIDCFIDGQTDGGIARRVMRENLATLAHAVQTAAFKQNLTRKFELRNHSFQNSNYP